eukprot:gb/GECG01002934.1/.p1 GENE.gb/GECG01002934.1/~~gb/GECG01002934.1/.p1  ORF type:complete len:667 (+),score=65.50 gb/GECG01002934.1/:1-2001(+)
MISLEGVSGNSNDSTSQQHRRNEGRPLSSQQCVPESMFQDPESFSSQEDEEPSKHQASHSTQSTPIKVDAPVLRYSSAAGNGQMKGETDYGACVPFGERDKSIERSGSFVMLDSDELEGSRQLARQLYGMSETEYRLHLAEKEEFSKMSRRQRVCGNIFTIRPFSRFKLLWDIFIALLVGYTAMTVPFEISFIETKDTSLVFFGVGIFVDVIFIVDIFVSFITGYWTPNDELVMTPKLTMKNYWRTYLWIDIISVLPIDYFALVNGFDGIIDPSRPMLVLRMMRLLRLLRLTKIFRYTKKYFAHVSPFRVNVTILAVSILLFIHMDACLLFLIGRLSDFAQDSWVTLSGIKDLNVGEQYLWSMYTSTSIMLCISYGSYIPQRTAEAVFISLSNLVGASIYAVVIATVTTLIMNANKSGAEFRQYMDEMNLFMRDYNLPKELRDRIRRYIRQRFPSSRKFDEVTLLHSLPRPLYRSIHINRLKSLTKKVPLLANTSDGFLESFVPELNTQLILADDEVVLQDEPVSGLYIIGDGECELIRGEETVLTLADGSFFGDVALLWDTREPFTVRAVSDCYVHVVPGDRFNHLIEYFPDVTSIMRKIATQRLERIGMDHVLHSERTDAAFQESSSMLNLDSLYNKVRHHRSESASKGSTTFERSGDDRLNTF